MAKASFDLPDELNQQIESSLGYGDSKAEWLRHAVEMRIRLDPILDELYERSQHEERLRLIETAVRSEVDRQKNQEVGEEG